MKRFWVCVLFLVGCGDDKVPETPDDGAASLDAAVPLPDAPPSEPPDAALPDAAVPDAPPDAPLPDVTVELAPPPVFTNHGPDRTVFATATNHTAGELALTVTATGDVALIADGACDHVAAGASCAITLSVNNATLGTRAGSLTVAGGDVTTSLAIAAKVDAFVGATVISGDGAVAFTPPAEAGCVGGGCYPLGTQVVMTQTPGAGFVLESWSPSCFGQRCTVVATATPIQAELTYLLGAALHLDLSGGLGEISLFPSTASFVQCRASCTVLVDPDRALDVYITSPVEVASIDGVSQGPNADSGTQRQYPAGTTAISVVFSPRPGEVDLLGDDLAFDRDNNLALVARDPDGVETVTVYDPAMAVKWSAPGDHVAFTRTGELYVERITTAGSTTTKYDADGQVLATAAIPLGFVTPDGGMLSPGPAANNLTRRDANLTAVAVLTLTAPFPGARGCLGLSAGGYNASVQRPQDFSELAYDRFALDGTYIDTKTTNQFSCHEVPDWDDGIVTSAFHPAELTASHDGLFVDDLAGSFSDLPYGASVDLAGNLYWMVAGNDNVGSAAGGSIKKYAPPSTTPVTTITRVPGEANLTPVGITPRKVVAAPDGRVAWAATWFDAFGFQIRVIQIFQP